MYIQQQHFNDIDTLIEQLFDFEMGFASPFLLPLIQEIKDSYLNNSIAQKTKSEITDLEEAMEWEDDFLREKLANLLLSKFSKFIVEKKSLYGVNNVDKTLLYTIELE